MKYEVVAHKKFVPGVGPLNDHWESIATEKAAKMIADTQWAKGQHKWVAVIEYDDQGRGTFIYKLGARQ